MSLPEVSLVRGTIPRQPYFLEVCLQQYFLIQGVSKVLVSNTSPRASLHSYQKVHSTSREGGLNESDWAIAECVRGAAG